MNDKLISELTAMECAAAMFVATLSYPIGGEQLLSPKSALEVFNNLDPSSDSMRELILNGDRWLSALTLVAGSELHPT